MKSSRDTFLEQREHDNNEKEEDLQRLRTSSVYMGEREVQAMLYEIESFEKREGYR
jgi:hypothetical protein